MGDEEYQDIRREMNTAVNIFPKIQLAESSHVNEGKNILKNYVTIM